MIKDLSPPWIYPKNQPVRVLVQDHKNYLEGVYCFKTKQWHDLKGQKITVLGWLDK